MQFEMDITLQNYQEYFVRYVDEELSSREADELEMFLQQHPRLRSELSAFKSTVLTADDEISFPRKELLKKGITLINYEDYFIRRIEGNISAEEEIEIKSFIADYPQLQGEYNVWMQTRLISDGAIIFPHKELLKKNEGGRVVPMVSKYVLMAVVAAGLMLLIFIKGIPWYQSAAPPVAQQQITPAPAESKPVDRAPETETLANAQQHNSASSIGSNDGRKTPVHPRHSTGEEEQNDDTVAESAAGENEQSFAVGDMAKIGTIIPPISYQARFRKAAYRNIRRSDEEKRMAENKPVKFSSVATALGGELLRLSGREDYLKTGLGFNESPKQKRVPLTLSIKGNRFDFYHRFFKNRKHSSTDQKQIEK
jgi:hypothetical protein